jgi:pyruvate/2-oxoglutarate dehydrogenase complex dihydrolipoamide acyltransferase (E2) component
MAVPSALIDALTPASDWNFTPAGNAKVANRSLMNLSLAIDHRALGGLAAARFLAQVKGWLEELRTPSFD